MQYDDVIALARAGFSAQQIAALAQATAPVTRVAAMPAEQQGVATTTTDPAPAAAPAPVAAPAPAPAPAPATDPMQQILAQMGVLTQAIQGSALLAATQPKPQTADDILAEIIAPPRKEDK